MTRKEFMKVCGILGVGLPMNMGMSACVGDDENATPFTGKVLIIGAGAGGLSAGYLLRQRGIDFEILEASSAYGGRMSINTDFADFPIPLGAEWLETDPGVFTEIVNDDTVSVAVTTIPDPPDRKFVNYSWFNFFEDYIVPSVADKIRYNEIVESIDYSGEQVMVRTSTGQYLCDKVMVAVPLKILQDEAIVFRPDLPAEKRTAISETTIWEGFKAFFEFSQKFYDDEYAFEVTPVTDGEKIYYDAALGQNTDQHILGLFSVGKPAGNFAALSAEELKATVLEELDALYDDQATPSYVRHLSQDWNSEPFIRAGYMSDHADWRAVRVLGTSVADKVYFSGAEYTDGEDWVSVHTAAQSAKRAVEELVNG